MTQCSITGCDREVEARGWCAKHYMRWKRTGSTEDRTPVVVCEWRECHNKIDQPSPLKRFCSVRCREKARVDRNGVCTICGDPAVTRQWCPKHYQRWQRTGDPLPRRREPKPTTCTICDRPYYEAGFCVSHYQHKLKYGDPLFTPHRITPEERFHSLVDLNGPLPANASLGRCEVWTGRTDEHGYGVMHIWMPERKKTRKVRAHRFSWELHTGSVPALFVCHRCDNPPCVRFSHLFEGTHRENMLDMVAKGRHGGRGHPETLADEQVLAIREAWAAHQRLPLSERRGSFRAQTLAEEHEISLSTLTRIVRGATYKTVGGPIHTPVSQSRKGLT